LEGLQTERKRFLTIISQTAVNSEKSDSPSVDMSFPFSVAGYYNQPLQYLAMDEYVDSS